MLGAIRRSWKLIDISGCVGEIIKCERGKSCPGATRDLYLYFQFYRQSSSSSSSSSSLLSASQFNNVLVMVIINYRCRGIVNSTVNDYSGLLVILIEL